MIRGIDHLVIACADPDAAATELESALGLTAAGGGRHEGMGTFNRIVWLADGSYLELIGVEDREAALGTPVGAAVVATLDAHGGGLATWALRDDELEVTVNGLPEGSFGPVVHGSRKRPDGELVEWWAAFPQAPLAPAGVPFLIQHAYVGAEWSRAALAERASFRHPIGSPVILARLDLATGDPPSTAAVAARAAGTRLLGGRRPGGCRHRSARGQARAARRDGRAGRRHARGRGGVATNGRAAGNAVRRRARRAAAAGPDRS